MRRGRDADVKSEVGGNAFFGFLKAGLSLGGKYSLTSEETGAETEIQKLLKVIDHIELEEKVSIFAKLCEDKKGVTLDAFCYSFSGKFFALGKIGREKSRYEGITISPEALARRQR